MTGRLIIAAYQKVITQGTATQTRTQVKQIILQPTLAATVTCYYRSLARQTYTAVSGEVTGMLGAWGLCISGVQGQTGQGVKCQI